MERPATSATASNLPSGTPPVSKVNFVYETLKEAIVSGQLKPGDTLVQKRIAENLGVSPIPVMAAMRRLIAEGLVSQEPHHPPRVSSVSREGLQELMAIRMHLEVLATRKSVPHIAPATAVELRRLVDEMSRALERKQLHRYGALNKAFHLKIYEACPYRLLVQMIKDLWDNTDRHGSRRMFTVSAAEQSHKDHMRIVELIEQGQADAVAELLEEHKARFRRASIPALG